MKTAILSALLIAATASAPLAVGSRTSAADKTKDQTLQLAAAKMRFVFCAIRDNAGPPTPPAPPSPGPSPGKHPTSCICKGTGFIRPDGNITIPCPGPAGATTDLDPISALLAENPDPVAPAAESEPRPEPKPAPPGEPKPPEKPREKVETPAAAEPPQEDTVKDPIVKADQVAQEPGPPDRQVLVFTQNSCLTCQPLYVVEDVLRGRGASVGKRAIDRIRYVNLDENPEVGNQFEVNSTPQVLLVEHGKVRSRLRGGLALLKATQFEQLLEHGELGTPLTATVPSGPPAQAAPMPVRQYFTPSQPVVRMIRSTYSPPKTRGRRGRSRCY